MNEGEYKSTIGLDSLYVAKVTADSAAAYTADPPEWLAPAAEASLEPNTSLDTQFADDQPYEVIASEAETKISLSVTAIPLEMLAKITGRIYDATVGRMYDHGGVPPYFALGFRSQKSNGAYRYYWFLKGKFSMPKEAMTTKGEKPEPKPAALEFTALRTIYKFDLDGGTTVEPVKRVVGDDDATNFSDTGWFGSVQTPASVVPAALALSSSDPADGAPGVAVGKTITLTFNNALPADAIANVVVVKADGAAVACVNSLDATSKIITVNPTGDLDGGSTYIVTYGLTDIYGQTLNGAINFATA